MATKGKDKIIDGQIAFDFLGEMEVEIKPRKAKVKNIEIKVAKKVLTRFRKEKLNIKHNHFKSSRKVRRMLRKFLIKGIV